jgi:flagellar export protein FliJ
VRRRFEFRLRRVARVRDIEEQMAREERAAAEARARAAAAAREQAREALEAARGELAKRLHGPLEARSVLSAHRLLDDHQRLLGERLREAAETRQGADQAAQVHRERKAAAQAMEKLRDRARDRHREALAREENAEMDEVASTRARRRAFSATAGENREAPSRSTALGADQAPVPSPDPAS